MNFKCEKCKSNNYKLILWELKNGGRSKGVYCFDCGKFFKFLRNGENIKGVLKEIKCQKQRERRKK